RHGLYPHRAPRNEFRSYKIVRGDATVSLDGTSSFASLRNFPFGDNWCKPLDRTATDPILQMWFAFDSQALQSGLAHVDRVFTDHRRFRHCEIFLLGKIAAHPWQGQLPTLYLRCGSPSLVRICNPDSMMWFVSSRTTAENLLSSVSGMTV